MVIWIFFLFSFETVFPLFIFRQLPKLYSLVELASQVGKIRVELKLCRIVGEWYCEWPFLPPGKEYNAAMKTRSWWYVRSLTFFFGIVTSGWDRNRQIKVVFCLLNSLNFVFFHRHSSSFPVNFPIIAFSSLSSRERTKWKIEKREKKTKGRDSIIKSI